MKKIIVSLAALLFVGTCAYAGNGDLVVNGSLGVGTPPTEKLHVSGNAFISGDAFFFNKSGLELGTIHYGSSGKIGQPFYTNWSPDEIAGLWIEGSNDSESGGIFMNGNTMALWSPGDSDILRIYDEDDMTFESSTPLFVVDPIGNVGIRMVKTGWTYGYALNVGGTVFSSGYLQGSDSKLKENVSPIESSLKKVMKLAGVSYTWKQESDDAKKDGTDPRRKGGDEKKTSSLRKNKKYPEGRHYGVIAQEIEKVLPEVVTEGPDGTKAVAYTEIIPVLIEAIKEQQKEIEELKKKVEGLATAGEPRL